MDFIGEKGPTSKLHLVLLDLLVLGLQVLNLGILLTMRKAKEASEPATSAARTAPSQTLDFEERGQHQSDHRPVDIELQDLNPSAAQGETSYDDADNERERDSLLATATPTSDAHLFDAFNSGEIVIGDLNIAAIVRDQFLNYRTPVMSEAGTTATGAGAGTRLSSASFTGTNLGFRFRMGNRIWGI